MSFINRDGVNIYYEVHGTGDRAIILSHGYSATSVMWVGQVNALKDRYRIVTWDMRGHGQSDSPDDPSLYSEAHTVQDMAAILDTCEIDKAIVGGLSLGGYMSLGFHASHVDRVSALLLFDTGPGYKNDVARARWNKMADERAGTLEKDGLAALGAGSEVRIASHRSAQGLAHAARGLLAQVNDRVIQSLPGIRLPTLVLVGENDTAFLTPTDYMAHKIPNAIKVVIKDAGHASNIDQPDSFNTAMLEFVESIG